jgi:thiamine biosynthesis lipoprotein
MGTGATLELRDPLPGNEAERLADDVFAWLHEVDRRFSTYRADSEVNRLDRGEIRLAECSHDLRHVLERCADLWQATDGYFDVYATGRLDPSGYVKGWSVQVASQRLTAAGAVNHLLDAGGDIQARGRPAPGEEWQIGVRHPWESSSVCWVLSGTDLAVATSGTYERGAHVINPRTGRPAAVLRSVTVVGRELALADAYATAALAMGLPALNWLARLDDHEAGVVTQEGVCYRSDALPAVAGPDRDAPLTTYPLLRLS